MTEAQRKAIDELIRIARVTSYVARGLWHYSKQGSSAEAALRDIETRLDEAAEGEDAAAINQTLGDARSQPVTPTNRQRLEARVGMGMTDPLTLEKLDVDREANAESRTLRQASADETRRYHDTLISQGETRLGQNGERIALSASKGEAPTLTQKARNFEIDAARKVIANLSPDEIKKKTQQYTATGRENPDYDPQLSRQAKRAFSRKVGEDSYFDQVMGGGADIPALTGENGPRGNAALLKEFANDPDMKGKRMGKRTEQGYEVLDKSGNLLGHYQ